MWYRRYPPMLAAIMLLSIILASNASAQRFLYYPLDRSYTITVVFGGYPGHKGTDYGCSNGTPVYAAAAGTVAAADGSKGDGTDKVCTDNGGRGNYVEISHSGGYKTKYFHLKHDGVAVSAGDSVQVGCLIGYSANSGNTSGMSGGCVNGQNNGYHLHFQVEKDGVAFDPYSPNIFTDPLSYGGDCQPPCTGVGSPVLAGADAGAWYPLGTQFTLCAYDNGGTGPITTRIWVDGGPDWGWGSYSSQYWGAPGSGTYTWHGQKHNCGGDSGVATRSFHVNYPPNKPSPASPADGALLASRTVLLAWNGAADPDGGPGSVRYCVNRSNWGGETGWLGTGASTTLAAPSDGTFTWQVQAADDWNASGYGGTRTFTVDTAAPTITLSGPAASTWLNGSGVPHSVAWSVSDVTSGMLDKKLTWDSGGQTNASPTPIPEGKRSATVWAKDRAGNESSQTFGPWWIDTAPPTPVIALSPSLPNGENEWYISDPTMTVVATDPNGEDASSVDQRFYSLDGAEETEFALPLMIEEDGIHTCSARATDVAGNSGETGPMVIRIDKTPPVFDLVYTDAVYRSLNTLAATWTCNDPESGIADYEYWIGSTPGDYDIVGATLTGGNSWAYAMNLDLSPGQTCYVTVRAKSVAGLWSDAITSAPIVVDEGPYDASPSLNAGGTSLTAESRNSTNYRMVDSIGQFVVSGSESPNFTMEHGYWHADISIPTVDGPAAAKLIANGVAVQIGSQDKPVVVISGTATFADRFYVESADRVSGIECQYGASGGMALVEGDRVYLTGKLNTVGNERVLQFAVTGIVEHGDPLKPLYMSVPSIGGAILNEWTPGVLAGIGLNNVGLLIKTYGGLVSYRDSQGRFFYLDNGDGLYDGFGYGIRVVSDGLVGGARLAMPAYGKNVIVTGISSVVTVSNQPARALRPRQQTDIQVLD